MDLGDHKPLVLGLNRLQRSNIDYSATMSDEAARQEQNGPFVSIEKTLKEAQPENTNHLIHRVVEQTICPICQDHMFVPFMTRCGHNFCYDCLSNWLMSQDGTPTCATCRTAIEVAPCLNVALRDLAGTLYASTIRILGHTPADLERERNLKMMEFKKDSTKHSLFGGFFKNTNFVLDDHEDGVQRCSQCHWEVADDDYCPNCGSQVRRRQPVPFAYDHQYSDDDFELETEEEAQLGGAVYPDSDDGSSFLDDREAGEIEVLSDSDGLSDDDRFDVIGRTFVLGNRSLQPYDNDDQWEDRLSDELSGLDEQGEMARSPGTASDYSAWNGFPEEHGPVSIDSDDNSEVFLVDDSDDDNNENLQRSVARRRVHILESDDDEELLSSDDDRPIVRDPNRRMVLASSDSE